jgi:CRISPR/Cas system CMR-associated protein Cmr5 small subunit
MNGLSLYSIKGNKYCSYESRLPSVVLITVAFWRSDNVLVIKITYLSSATRVLQLKICDFSGETFKDFEVL